VLGRRVIGGANKKQVA
jgi:hypothetical protein